MRRLITIAMVAGLVLAGSGGLAAQGTSGASPRPFSNVFATPSQTPDLRDAVRKAFRRELRAQQQRLSTPPSAHCHMIVVPADPAIDPHFSVAPQSTTRFLLREERTDHLCR